MCVPFNFGHLSQSCLCSIRSLCEFHSSYMNSIFFSISVKNALGIWMAMELDVQPFWAVWAFKSLFSGPLKLDFQ